MSPDPVVPDKDGKADSKPGTRLVRQQDIARSRLGHVLRGKVSVQSLIKGSTDGVAALGRLAGRRSGLSGPCIGPLKKLVHLWRAPEARHAIYAKDGTLIVATRDGDPLTAAAERNVPLANADLAGLTLKKRNMQGLKAEGADFSLTAQSLIEFDRAKLSGASFRRAQLRGVSFDGADLSGADFTRASFGQATKVWYERRYKYIDDDTMDKYSKKVDTSFRSANLEGARFSVDCDFKVLGLSSTQRDQIILVDRAGNDLAGASVTSTGEVLFTDFAPADDTPKLPTP